MRKPVVGLPPAGRPRSHVVRPRLGRLWTECERARLVVVCAGAGFGKTTFLADAAAQSSRPVHWLTLEEGDAEVERLAWRLAGAVGVEVGSRGPTGGAGGERLDDTLSAIVRRLADVRGRPLVVLDDAHLAAGLAVGRFLERCVTYLPAGGTIVVSSREPAGIATMKLQASGDLARIGAAELAFDDTETAALFSRHWPGRELPGELLRRIHRRVEGWPAGLEIFFQGLTDGRREEIEAALDGASAARGGWFDYFAEEVVRRLDERERTFLLGTSILARLSPERCDRLLGRRDGRRMIEALVARNLFLFPDGERPRDHRFHGLFRIFLRGLFEREAGPADRRAHRRRAAALFRSEGSWGEAAEALVEAGDFTAALRIVERHATEMMTSGGKDTIRRALSVVPRRELDRHPAALLALARVHDQEGEWPEAEALARRALRSAGGGLSGEIVADLAAIRMRRGDAAGARALGRRALRARLTAPAPVRARLLGTLGIAACELGRLDEGEECLRRAGALLRRPADREQHRRTFYLLPANIHYRRGDFRRAREAARDALVEFRRAGDRRRTCHCLGVLAYLAAESAEVREARDLAADCLRLAESLDYPLMAGYARLALSRCALVEGNGATARDEAEAARELGRRLGEPGLRTISLARLAEAAMQLGDRRAALEWAHRSLDVSRELRDIYQEAESNILLGELYAAGGDGRSARGWNRAEAIVRRVGAGFLLNRLLLRRLDHESTPAARTRARLAELMGGVSSLGHDFLFRRLAPAAAARVLAHALRLDVEPGSAARLLSEIGPDAAGPVTRLLDDGREPVRRVAVEVLGQIGGPMARRALSRAARGKDPSAGEAGRVVQDLREVPGPPLRIRALGRLEIESGPRRIGFDDWSSARALRLFQLLLVRRFRWVSREEIIETLWPEIDPERGRNNLRQSIHLLRRALDPAANTPVGASRVRTHGDGCRLDPGENPSYDVAELEDAVRRGEALSAGGRDAAAAREWSRAIELYSGPFLAESPGEELVAAERERLRDLFLRALRRALASRARRARWDEIVPLARRGLAEDPWEEELHHHLLQALDRLGHRREALEAWQAYERAMVGELGILPSPRMKQLADRITAPGA